MVLSVSFLHFGRQFTGGKHKGHSGSGQQGRTDVPGHIRAGGIVECCADLGADKGTDAVADEDQAIVAVVIFAAEHVFDDGRKHDQQPAEREADQADAGDEAGQRFGDRQHAHRKAVENQYQHQRIPALELIIDKAKADAAAHVGQRHDGNTHGGGHSVLADLVLRDGRRGTDHHRTGGVGKDEHNDHDPEHRGHDHPGDIVVFGVQLLGLGGGRGPALGHPAFGAGHDHPRDRADADQEHNGQNAAGHLCAVGVDEPLGDERHDEGAAGCTRLHQTGDGTGFIGEPFQCGGQAGRVDRARTGTRHNAIEKVKLRDAGSKAGQEPASGEEYQADVDGYAGLEL